MQDICKLTPGHKRWIVILILVGSSVFAGLQARGSQTLDVDAVRKIYTLYPERREEFVKLAVAIAKSCIEASIRDSLVARWQEAYLVTTDCIPQFRKVLTALGYGEEEIKKNFDLIWVQVRKRGK